MPDKKLSHTFLLPELKLTNSYKAGVATFLIHAEKVSKFEVCPKCATPSSKVHDRRTVKIKDAPIRGKLNYLVIVKT